MKIRKSLAIVAALVAAATTLSACGGTSDNGSADNANLTVWTWDGTVSKTVAGFEKENPGIKVKIVNAGSSYEEYKSLDNAIQAGSGVPDIAQFEYFAIPYFAIPGKLADLSEYGADFSKDYIEGAWADVTVDGKPYALPSDYGPAAMFYNQKILTKAGINNPPKTWEEYYQDAKKVRQLGKDYYITNMSGDLFMILQSIWQAGGRPYKVDGESTKINFKDAGSSEAIDYWQKMIDEDLVNTKISNWSDDWNRALNDGTLATQLIGGWMTSNLPDRAPDQAGNYRVSMLPQWKEGESVGAENGGSSMAIPEASKNKTAAFKFLEYMTHGDGVSERVKAGAYVPNLSVVNDESILNSTNPYFGDQKYNQVLAQASKAVQPGWQFPPFFEYARDIWQDIVDPVVTKGEGTLESAFDQWTKECIDYGNKQGFKVS